MSKENTGEQKVFWRGWAMVGLAFILSIVPQGFGIYHFSMIRGSLVDALGATSAEVGFAYSWFALSLAIMGLFIGSILNKIGVRWSVRISAVIYSIGFIVVAFATNLPMVFVGYILLGAGNAFAGVLIVTGIPSNWIVKRRGIANGVIWGATFFASLICTNFVAFFVTNYNYQVALIGLAILSFVIIMAVSFFIVWRPQDEGLLPDGLTPEQASEKLEEAGSAKVVGLTRGQAMKTRTFWVMFVAIFLIGVGEMGPFQNLVMFTRSMDFDIALGAAIMSTIGFVSLFAKLGCGWLIDKFGARIAYLTCEILAGAGLVLMMFITPESSLTFVWVSVILFGFGESAAIVCFTAACGQFMGVKNYAQIFGVIFLAKALGDAVGSPLIAAIAEGAMGWPGAFGIAAACCIISAIIFLFARKEKGLVALEKQAAQEMQEALGEASAKA